MNSKEAYASSVESNNDDGASSKWSILEEYAKTERARVDGLKRLLREDADNQTLRARYEREQILEEPTRMQKIGRALLDIAHISPRKIAKQRGREAMAVALKEVRAEDELATQEAAEREVLVKQEAAKQAEREAQARQEAAERAERDKNARRLKEEMGAYWREKEAQDQFKNERSQELTEREFNGRLTRVSDLYELSAAPEQSGVAMRTEKYKDSEVVVYDLNLDKINFAGIVTSIHYKRGAATSSTKQGEMSAKLSEDPSVWAEHTDGRVMDDAWRNTIHTSYINMATKCVAYVNHDDQGEHTVYGFEKVDSKSVLAVTPNDAGSGGSSNPERAERVMSVNELEKAQNPMTYNEIKLRRYSETGKPKLPDYILAHDGEITDNMLKHAKFYGIPIINMLKYDTISRARKNDNH